MDGTDALSPTSKTVEIKLEEMFAGIDDEQSIHVNKESANVPKPIEIEERECNFFQNLPEKTLQTKAAVKSTVGYTPVKSSNTKSVEKVSTNTIDWKNIEANLKKIDTGRREKSNATMKSKKSGSNNRKMLNVKKKPMSKSKIKKRKLAYAEAQADSKLKQKLKNRRTSNNVSSSDNENEADERTQQNLDSKYKSPFILIKNDGAIAIVNAVTTDDLNDKNTKSKKPGSFVVERKNVKGIYSSTLSNKYDADTADSTWICVFCKRGPHKKGLGDLFGPYNVSIDCDEYKNGNVKVQNPTTDFVIRRDMNSDETIAPRKAKCETFMFYQGGYDENMRSPHQSCMLGMPRGVSGNQFEVWFHEDCAVWAPNLFLVGSQLVGLDNAIWNSARHECVSCLRPGAIICCLQRDCKETVHLACARETKWHLDESKFWAYCLKHKSKCFTRNTN